MSYEWTARFVSLSEQYNLIMVAAQAGGAAGAVARKDLASTEAVEADLRCAVLVLSVIAIVSPGDVTRDTCVRLVNTLLQMVETQQGLVRACVLLSPLDEL